MTAYIVVFDDEQGLCAPYCLDPDCDGALAGTSGTIAGFKDRKSAQKAIAISVRFAMLCQAQGIPAVDDFLGQSRKCVKIRKVEIAE